MLHTQRYTALFPFVFVQALVNEVNGYGDKKITVENTGSRLTELSRKEDCDVIHNLIMTVQDRYKKLQQRTSERGRMLEEVKKNTKQVHSYTNSSVFLHLKNVFSNIYLYFSYFSLMNLGAYWWTGWPK